MIAQEAEACIRLAVFPRHTDDDVGLLRSAVGRFLRIGRTETLSRQSPLAAAHAPLLGDAVSDRGQLRQLDHLLALWTAEAASRRGGVRAFRALPWRRLRALGLPSLVVARNR